jgi:hypothetical protein
VTKPTRKKLNQIIYARDVSLENMRWIYGQMAQTDRTMKAVVEELIACQREKREFKLDPRMPAYIQKAMEAKERRKKRNKGLISSMAG